MDDRHALRSGMTGAAGRAGSRRKQFGGGAAVGLMTRQALPLDIRGVAKGAGPAGRFGVAGETELASRPYRQPLSLGRVGVMTNGAGRVAHRWVDDRAGESRPVVAGETDRPPPGTGSRRARFSRPVTPDAFPCHKGGMAVGVEKGAICVAMGVVTTVTGVPLRLDTPMTRARLIGPHVMTACADAANLLFEQTGSTAVRQMTDAAVLRRRRVGTTVCPSGGDLPMTTETENLLVFHQVPRLSRAMAIVTDGAAALGKGGMPRPLRRQLRPCFLMASETEVAGRPRQQRLFIGGVRIMAIQAAPIGVGRMGGGLVAAVTTDTDSGHGPSVARWAMGIVTYAAIAVGEWTVENEPVALKSGVLVAGITKLVLTAAEEKRTGAVVRGVAAQTIPLANNSMRAAARLLPVAWLA